MITPLFEITQNQTHLFIKIKCPYIKQQELETMVNENEFRFYCKPYFLRLEFQKKLQEESRLVYDADQMVCEVDILKQEQGEFTDLDLLTNLTKKPQQPMIEDLSVALEMEESELDWSHPQEFIEPLEKNTYGFNNLYQGYGQTVLQMAHDIIDLQDLDQSSLQSRREFRLMQEELRFDPEHYMADLMDDEEIQRLIQFKPETHRLLKRQQENQQIEIVFTEKQREIMLQLKYKEYLIDPSHLKSIYLGLVDVVFAHQYNHRTTEGEPTVESAWTICKLSATLSCFDVFTSLEDVVKSIQRRALVYPLYRHWELVQKVWKDVLVAFKLGKLQILQILLDCKFILERNEITHVFDRIWITDYCTWIQQANDKNIKSLAKELHHFSFDKHLNGFHLDEIEQQYQQESVHDTMQEPVHEGEAE
ncbi:SHQ1 protein-domain-containing protein [Gorgonomyces haynaldii]|nr:SHQ1 protein-domain-containing protein [Gorgonomyces haynaldii]